MWLPGSSSYQNEDTLLELENLQNFRCQKGSMVTIESEVEKTNKLSSVLIKLPRISAVSYDFISNLPKIDLKNSLPEFDEISCKAFYNAGIFEEYYGIKKLEGIIVE